MARKVRLTAVTFEEGDWCALYWDDEKVFEGHSLDLNSFLRILEESSLDLPFVFEERTASPEADAEACDSGSAPDALVEALK